MLETLGALENVVSRRFSPHIQKEILKFSQMLTMF